MARKAYLIAFVLIVAVELISIFSITHPWLFIAQGIILLIMIPVSRAMTRESKRRPAGQVALICTLFIIGCLIIGYTLFIVNW